MFTLADTDKMGLQPFASVSVLVSMTVSVSASMNTSTQFYTTHFFIGVVVRQCEHYISDPVGFLFVFVLYYHCRVKQLDLFLVQVYSVGINIWRKIKPKRRPNRVLNRLVK